MAEKTHWRRLVNPDYLGVYSLEAGKDLTVIIDSVKLEMVTGDGGKKEECMVAYIKGNKPLILNRTNSRMIQKLYNTPYVEEWSGKAITLFASTTRVAGETVECLRIRPNIPVPSVDVKKATQEVLAAKDRTELDGLWKKHNTHSNDKEFLDAVKKMGLKYPHK